MIPLSKSNLKLLSGIQSEENKNYLILDFSGFTFPPSIITNKLSLIPFETGLKGESYKVGNTEIERIYESNYWKYQTVVTTNDFIGDLVESFINSIILPKVEKFIELSEDTFCELSIIQYYQSGNNPGFYINNKLLRILSSANINLNIDFYVLYQDKEI